MDFAAEYEQIDDEKFTPNGDWGFAMKYIAGAIVIAMVACCSPAVADDIDLSTWTCKKFQTADKETIEIILTWLDGYYKDQDDPPIIETDTFVENAKKLGEYCAAHPDIGLITAADKLFSSDDK
jgi:acid stress chaperone HdeB